MPRPFLLKLFLILSFLALLSGCARRNSFDSAIDEFAMTMAEKQVIGEQCKSLKVNGKPRETGAFGSCLVAKKSNKKCAVLRFLTEYDRQVSLLRIQYRFLSQEQVCSKAYKNGELNKWFVKN